MMSTELQPPQTPPRTPQRLLDQSLSPLQSSPGPFAHLSGLTSMGRDDDSDVDFDIELDDDDSNNNDIDNIGNIGSDDDDIDTHDLFGFISSKPYNPPPQIGFSTSDFYESPSAGLPFSRPRPPYYTKAARTRPKGSLSSTASSARLLGFSSMHSPTPNKPKEAKREIHSRPSMRTRELSHEKHRAGVYIETQVSSRTISLDVAEGDGEYAPQHESTIHVAEEGLGLIDIEYFMSDSLCRDDGYIVSQPTTIRDGHLGGLGSRSAIQRSH
ncbi:hypothetical protein QCA50_005229 [Cerrena zonata]|uniref:Uncharacterized protein n=1 Tax=Cerrena zonata TaxID=2478898 RepID=A0AAW0GRF4_9APHY